MAIKRFAPGGLARLRFTRHHSAKDSSRPLATADCLLPLCLAALALLLAACATTQEPAAPSAQPPAGAATPGAVVAVQTAVPPDVITGPIDGAVYVYVPAGEFLMGSADSDRDRAATGFEEPQHTVYMNAYWIGQTEATNAQHALCVAAGKCATPDYANYEGFNGDTQPVVGVSWDDATAYCQCVGVGGGLV